MIEQRKLRQPDTQPVKKKDNVVIIGGGFTGTVTAIRLIHNATKPLEITFLEKTEEKRHRGVAYSRDTAGWEHLLNIQAGRITAFREDPNDFMQWANGEADRKSWPLKWKG